MARLYTKTGDNGRTTLYDQKDIPKHDIIFDALGDLDELSAHIGMLCTFDMPPGGPSIHDTLRKIQNILLNIGSDLSTRRKRTKVIPITFEDIRDLEDFIDYYSAAVPELKNFILPGVFQKDAIAHICRSVCRRTERNMLRVKDVLGDELPTDNNVFIYMNRLSDYFFALARYLSGGKETERYSTQNLVINR